MSGLSRSIYCATDGTYALLETPEGLIPPPLLTVGCDGSTVELACQGEPSSVFARLSNHGCRQADLATLAGVGQQAVSRYVRGAEEPRLSAAGWAAIMRAYAPTFVFPAEGP